MLGWSVGVGHEAAAAADFGHAATPDRHSANTRRSIITQVKKLNMSRMFFPRAPSGFRTVQGELIKRIQLPTRARAAVVMLQVGNGSPNQSAMDRHPDR